MNPSVASANSIFISFWAFSFFHFSLNCTHKCNYLLKRNYTCHKESQYKWKTSENVFLFCSFWCWKKVARSREVMHNAQFNCFITLCHRRARVCAQCELKCNEKWKLCRVILLLIFFRRREIYFEMNFDCLTKKYLSLTFGLESSPLFVQHKTHKFFTFFFLLFLWKYILTVKFIFM